MATQQGRRNTPSSFGATTQQRTGEERPVQAAMVRRKQTLCCCCGETQFLGVLGRYSSAPAKGKDDPYEMAGRYARHHQKSKRRKYAGAPEVAVQPPTGTEQLQGACAPAFLKLLRQLVFEQVPQRPCRQAHPQARAENTPKGNPGSALQRPVPREPRAEIPRPASRQMAATRRRTPCSARSPPSARRH